MLYIDSPQFICLFSFVDPWLNPLIRTCAEDTFNHSRTSQLADARLHGQKTLLRLSGPVSYWRNSGLIELCNSNPDSLLPFPDWAWLFPCYSETCSTHSPLNTWPQSPQCQPASMVVSFMINPIPIWTTVYSTTPVCFMIKLDVAQHYLSF